MIRSIILLTSLIIHGAKSLSAKHHWTRATTKSLSSSYPTFVHAKFAPESCGEISNKNECTSRRQHLSILTSLVAINGGLIMSSLLPITSNAQQDEDSEQEIEPPSHNDLKQKEMHLWKKLYQRKPSSYTQSEREEIDVMVENIARSAQGSKWERDLLPGKWKVAYIRPGQDGGGLERRIPFPELPFNESYQQFTLDSVTNIGELLGPAVLVKVGGDLMEEDDADFTPKRFRADINRGNLCAGQRICVKLPIEGVGLFDGIYLGERIRIGQNLSGSGALVVQVRS